MHFTSPTYGRISVDTVIEHISAYMEADPKARYKLIIGTDSQTTRKHTVFVSALIVQRIGKGARFFFRKSKRKTVSELRHRVYLETELSLQLMEALHHAGFSSYLSEWPVEVHLDVGQKGETRQLIQDVVGWVTAVGYIAKIKPDAYGASSVADRYTK